MDFLNWDFAPLRWDFSMSTSALVTIGISILTYLVLRGTKKMQKTQIELIKTQNELLKQQTIASTALAKIAKEKEYSEVFQNKLELLEHLIRMARCVADSSRKMEVSISADYVKRNMPMCEPFFSGQEYRFIRETEKNYSQYLIEKENVEMGREPGKSGVVIQQLSKTASSLLVELYGMYGNVRRTHFSQ